MSSTLVDRLTGVLPDSPQSLRVLPVDGGPEVVPWPAVFESALRRTAALRAQGVEPGDRVAVLGAASRPALETLIAAWLAGAVPVVLPQPLKFTDAGRFAAGTRDRVAEVDARVVLFDPQHRDAVAGMGAPVVEQLSPEPTSVRPAEPVAVDPADTAILQFTSGSTSRPKAVRLSHRAVTANVRAMADAAAFSRDDHFVTWLPLYHDMGLIGTFLCPTLLGSAATLMPTEAFMRSPGRWMRAVSDHRGTVTAGPNFAYALAARLLHRAKDLDLSSLRAAFCGAEPIVPATLAEFVARGAGHGLREDVVLPCYGMAETTLGVSFAPLGRPVKVDLIARSSGSASRSVSDTNRDGGSSGPAEVVSLGLPLRGTAVRVVDEDGTELGERQVGELHVAAPSLMEGYLDGAADPLSATGWLATGDLGYLADGEVHVCGRVKDLIIVNGHNIHPHEVEAVAEEVPHVRTGGAVAFGVEDAHGRESIVVLCESRVTPEKQPELVEAVRGRIAEAVGVAPGRVGIVPPRWVPKTTSGKLQRSLARERWLNDGVLGADDQDRAQDMELVATPGTRGAPDGTPVEAGA